MEKLDISLLFKNKNNQMNFITHAALYFKLHIDSLFELFDICSIFDVSDETEFFELIKKKYKSNFEPYVFTFGLDSTVQNVSKQDFREYYARLLEAETIDKFAFQDCLNEILDTNFNRIETNYNGEFKEGEFLTVIKYQIKYSLTIKTMGNIFGIQIPDYSRRVQNTLKDYPELLEKFKMISDFYSDTFKYKNAMNKNRLGRNYYKR